MSIVVVVVVCQTNLLDEVVLGFLRLYEYYQQFQAHYACYKVFFISSTIWIVFFLYEPFDEFFIKKFTTNLNSFKHKQLVDYPIANFSIQVL